MAITLEGIQELFNESGNLKHVAEALGVNYHTLYSRMKREKWPTVKELKKRREDGIVVKPIAGGYHQALQDNAKKLEGTCFIITSAQNNTEVFKPFWKSLENYAEYRDARILVSTFAYNKQGWGNVTKDDDELWYAPELAEHTLNEHVELSDGLVLCGELDILPTAILPLSGLQAYTKSASTIVPHVKMHMESVATAKDKPTKLMYSTGTCTLRNYIQRKVGQKAEFHHVYGALIVEVDDDGDWFVRQLIADSKGRFQDLDVEVTPKGVHSGASIDAITYGDIHIEKCDPEQIEICKDIRDTLKPKYQLLHDTTDFTARNHHNRRDPHFLAKMHYESTETVKHGMDLSAAFVHTMEREGTKTVIVDSNHDQAFLLWLKDQQGHSDAPNSMYWHEHNYYVLKDILDGKKPSPFKRAVSDSYKEQFNTPIKARFLEEDESFSLKGVELGAHGHRGPNGSRGNLKNHRNLGMKYTIDHSHSTGIIDGVYIGGVTGRDDMGYNVGPSSWSHSHVIQYPSGKRAIITAWNRKWRAHQQGHSNNAGV